MSDTTTPRSSLLLARRRHQDVGNALVRLIEVATGRHLAAWEVTDDADSIGSPSDRRSEDGLLDEVVRLVAEHDARRRTAAGPLGTSAIMNAVSEKAVTAFAASALHTFRRSREEEGSVTPPPDLQALVDEWHRPLRRPVILVDETRRPLYGGGHREFLVFVAVCMSPEQVVTYLERMQERRRRFPAGWEEMTIKGQGVWQDELKPEFAGAVEVLKTTLQPPVRSFICATTQKNIDASTARATIKTVPPIGEKPDGRPAEVRGRELILAENFILRLCEELGERVRVDVVIDKSQALGLEDKMRKLPEGKSELFFGPLAPGSPEVCIISASDSEHSKDLVLLPDFCGNALLHKSQGKLGGDLDRVTTDTPFWVREIGPQELESAIQSGMDNVRRT